VREEEILNGDARKNKGGGIVLGGKSLVPVHLSEISQKVEKGMATSRGVGCKEGGMVKFNLEK